MILGTGHIKAVACSLQSGFHLSQHMCSSCLWKSARVQSTFQLMIIPVLANASQHRRHSCFPWLWWHLPLIKSKQGPLFKLTTDYHLSINSLQRNKALSSKWRLSPQYQHITTKQGPLFKLTTITSVSTHYNETRPSLQTHEDRKSVV